MPLEETTVATPPEQQQQTPPPAQGEQIGIGTAGDGGTAQPIENFSTSFQFQSGTQPQGVDFEKIVPEGYKDKEFVKNILKSENPNKVQVFFEMFENSQKALGQRGVSVPGENATPEEKQAYAKAIGVPESIEGYVIKPTAWDEGFKEIGQQIESAKVPELMNPIKEAAKNLNVTPAQLQGLIEAHDKATASLLAKQGTEAKAAQDAEFEQQSAQLFGDRKDQILQTGGQMLRQLTPPQLQPYLKQLDNKSALILAGVLANINDRYIREDRFNQPSGQGVTAPNVEQLRAQARDLMATDAYRKADHRQHDKTVKDVNAIYDQIRRLTSGR